MLRVPLYSTVQYCTQPASWWTRAAASDSQKAAASRSRKGEREGNVGAASWVGHVTRGRRPSIHRPGRGNRGERARAVPVPPRIRGPRQLHIGFCSPFRHGRDPRSRLFRSPPGHPRNPRGAGPPSPSRVWLGCACATASGGSVGVDAGADSQRPDGDGGGVQVQQGQPVRQRGSCGCAHATRSRGARALRGTGTGEAERGGARPRRQAAGASLACLWAPWCSASSPARAGQGQAITACLYRATDQQDQGAAEPATSAVNDSVRRHVNPLSRYRHLTAPGQ